MILEIDFHSEEALYMQLRNQIVIGIATSQLLAGESLPSVRQLADMIGINMHTVNKAYALLRQEGYVKLDRRRGAVVAVDIDKLDSMAKMKAYLRPLIARGICKGLSKEEVKGIVDQLYDELS